MTTTLKNICIINGHPDDDDGHYIWALADAYQKGAQEAGHDVSRVDLAKQAFSYLRKPKEFLEPSSSQDILDAQRVVEAADHLVFLFPLWMGGVPAYTRAWLEAMARGGFMTEAAEEARWPVQNMKGKSLRVIVTMGMPSTVYRLFFGAFGVRAIERGIFGISGFHPIHHTLIGLVEALGDDGRANWLRKVEDMGRFGR